MDECTREVKGLEVLSNKIVVGKAALEVAIDRVQNKRTFSAERSIGSNHSKERKGVPGYMTQQRRY